MRMSCNGCRVLRKGCTEDCSIRPCLQWIKNPESQANATLFLAKFYGRAGLINLINAGPAHLRPAIFRSLLYEACGRIANPIYGSVGLLWSGNWQVCQSAVEAVLKGAPVEPIPSVESAAAPLLSPSPPPLITTAAAAAAANNKPNNNYNDIRHVSKNTKNHHPQAAELLRVSAKTRARFKRSAGAKPCAAPARGPISDCRQRRPQSPDSSASRASDDDENGAAPRADDDVEFRESDRLSVDTVEAGSHVSQAEPSPAVEGGADQEDETEEEAEEAAAVGLELTLGLEPVSATTRPPRRSSATETRCELSAFTSDSFRLDLGLQLSA
ncbi:LOB domain-containing protein 41 [Ananas comosus]|uniref:LOB domain-containing protein 41 n=1 Tax=Ananas comosus TaxID=4615 RepID=A0A199V7X4_ANACO|nr:LOB domain-containing protein 41 [Ananas comosus]